MTKSELRRANRSRAARRLLAVRLGLIAGSMVAFLVYWFGTGRLGATARAQTFFRSAPSFLADREPPPQLDASQVEASAEARRQEMQRRFKAGVEQDAQRSPWASDMQRQIVFGEVALPRNPDPPANLDGVEIVMPSSVDEEQVQ